MVDPEVVDQARTDPDAFAHLYRYYVPRIHAFSSRRCGSRDMADDITAVTFERALRGLESFQWERGGFGAWLFRIAANELVDHHRAAARATSDRDARRGPSVPARHRFTAAVAATAVLVAGFAYAAATRSGEGTTQLSSATDTSVVLPDGSIVAATEGFDLPNGTLVITGPEGSASVDGVTIPQNSQAVIEDGTARLVSSTTTTSAPQQTTASTSRPGVGVVTTTPSTRPVERTTTTRPQEPTSTTRPEPVRMELQATRVEARVVGLRWSMYRAPDFKQYSIVRTVRAADGPGAENAVVFTTNDRGRLTFNDRLPAGVEHAGYRVIALDRAGRVVGASPIVHI